MPNFQRKKKSQSKFIITKFSALIKLTLTRIHPYLDNAENKKELVNVVNKIIKENNLGSTIFMSSENYLKLILSFPCKQCGCHNLSLKRWRVKVWGLYLNITQPPL